MNGEIIKFIQAANVANFKIEINLQVPREAYNFKTILVTVSPKFFMEFVNKCTKRI